jgi:hypothetical protein
MRDRRKETDDAYFGRLSPEKSKDTKKKKEEADRKKKTTSEKQGISK